MITLINMVNRKCLGVLTLPDTPTPSPCPGLHPQKWFCQEPQYWDDSQPHSVQTEGCQRAWICLERWQIKAKFCINYLNTEWVILQQIRSEPGYDCAQAMAPCPPLAEPGLHLRGESGDIWQCSPRGECEPGVVSGHEVTPGQQPPDILWSWQCVIIITPVLF